MASLYERVLGPRFKDLAHVLHHFHGSTSHGRARGRLAVEHGTGRAARFVARILKLPDESPQADVTLQVTVESDHELWERTFGERKLRTRIWTRDGLLAESIGPLTLGFQLLVADGGLDFNHTRTWLCGIPLPKWLAPRAEAHVKPAGERWKIDMRLSHPWLGLVVRYHGTMAAVAPEASKRA
jgi:hypothetical protein